tara:strand:- start:297 stop:1019 length:723 start_codon:yes stop_codon:yes gene_type:complete
MTMKQYQTAAEKLRNAITSGEYPPGSKLPTERELCHKLEVSRITVRQALSLLETEQLINRKQGSGTFVRKNHIPRIPLNIDYASSMNDHATELVRTLLMSKWIKPDEVIAERLHISNDEDVLYAERLDQVEGSPIAWDQAYIPMRTANGLTEKHLAELDFVTQWTEACQFEILSCEQTVEATAAGVMQAKHLKVQRKSPVLKTDELFITATHEPAGLFISFYHPKKIYISTYHRWNRHSV